MADKASDLDLVSALRSKISSHKPCRGYGKVLDKEKRLVDCECRREALFQYRLAHSGIPPKFRRMGFKDYVYKEGGAYAKVMAYLAQARQHRQDGIGLFLYGPSYTGKSLLACSLLMELMRAGYDCKYVSFDGVLDSRDEKPLPVDREWDFLVLDRVGDVLNRLSNFREAVLTGDRTHGAVDYLTAIVSKRVTAGRPIIMPCSVPLPAIDEKFPSLANALVGSCVVVECEDKGFRQRRIDLMMEPE